MPHTPELPTITLGGRDPTPEREAAAAREAGRAARDIGFFSIADHGVPDTLIADAFAAATAFFAEPLEAKEAFALRARGDNRGYVAVGDEALDPGQGRDRKEAYNLGVSTLYGGAAPESWPDTPGFRRALSAYRAEMIRLSARIHRLFALDLGLPPDFFASSFREPASTLRLLHYPPSAGPDTGAGVHTDYGNITLLAQDDAGGLEVRRRDGAWMAAPPAPGEFICNIGDCLMRWSNDIYVSTPHRVTSPQGRDRYSIAYFSDPDADADVRCLPGCEGPGRPARYAPILAGDHLRARLDATYAHRSGA